MRPTHPPRSVLASAPCATPLSGCARGPASRDGARTDLTAGLHAGRFLSPHLSAGGELRHPRGLTDAAPVRGDADARETWTAARGARSHLPLAGERGGRPGVSWTHAPDAPLEESRYDMIRLDRRLVG